MYGGEPVNDDDNLVLPLIDTITLGDLNTTPSIGEFYEGANEHTFDNLDPNTERTFVIVAHNSSGVGLAQVTARTRPAEITQTPDLQVQEISATSATLIWNSIAHASSYQVVFGSTDSGEPSKVLTFESNVTTATIDGLAPNTTYGFTVIGANVLGESASEPVTVTTPAGPGAIVEDVTSPADKVIRVDGTNDGDSTAGVPPVNEDIDKAFDNTTRKYLNFVDEGSGIIVTPEKGATVVTGVRVYTANDWEARDPASYLLEGLNADGEYEPISDGPLDLPAARNVASDEEITVSNSLNQDTVTFENTKAYSTYRLTFPTLKDAGATNSMQVAEIELLGTIAEPDTTCAVPSLDSISDCAENLAQRDELLTRLDLLLADLDGDGTVGFRDFLILAGSFGKNDQRYTDGDIDLNRTVGFTDFLALATQFGKSL